MSLAEAVNDQGASARARYDKLEDRVLARQVGARRRPGSAFDRDHDALPSEKLTS